MSYAGYDIVQDQSGTHTDKTKISKKGNSYIRSAFYMLALSAAKYNNKLKTTLHPSVQNKGQ